MRAILSFPLGVIGFAIAFALSASLGCSSTSSRLSWKHGLANDGELRVAIAPLNLAVALAPELEQTVGAVENALFEFFLSRDARVAVVQRADAWRLWREVIAMIQNSESIDLEFDTAARLFVNAVSEHDDFDLFVMPALVFREALASGRWARWDGVRRRIHFYDRSAARSSELDNTEWRLSGLSLHTIVFTPDGERVSQGWGGLDIVHDPIVARDQIADRPALRLRRELLENPEYIREGVGIALKDYALETRR